MIAEWARSQRGGADGQRPLVGSVGPKIDLAQRIGEALIGAQQVADRVDTAPGAEIIVPVVAQADVPAAAAQNGGVRSVRAPGRQPLVAIEIGGSQGEPA